MDRNSLRKQIRDIRAQTGIGWDIIEQDYVLSAVLFGVSHVEKLKSTLIFKGGTALKKCYFGNYRFSQDLDFSVQDDYPQGDELLQLMEEACAIAGSHLENVAFQCKRYPAKNPHPEGQEAFDIRAQLPWQRESATTVKVEITIREEILLKPIERPILHAYDDSLKGGILVYRVEEIIAEKIRAILQFAKKLHERGWGRSRVRDYYDLWRIFQEYGHEIDRDLIPGVTKQKCENKGISFDSVDALFQEKLMEHLREWDQWLSPIVPDIPEKNRVVQELRLQLANLFQE